MINKVPECAICPFKMSDRLCKKEDGKAPPSCPIRDKEYLTKNCLNEYAKADILEFVRQAAIQESDGYANREQGYKHLSPSKPRVEERIDVRDDQKISPGNFETICNPVMQA